MIKFPQLEKQVDSLSRQRQERRKHRVSKNVPIISLVGYTNAGKSTLLNTLTQSEVLRGKENVCDARPDFAPSASAD